MQSGFFNSGPGFDCRGCGYHRFSPVGLSCIPYLRKNPMQFALVAHDYQDDGALERRLACREAHLERTRALAAQGGFLSGGAIVDASGKMVGSNAHFSFPDRAAFDAWLEAEPYIVGRVWETIAISEVRLFNPAA
jgi:uncharacterized protein YciI